MKLWHLGLLIVLLASLLNGLLVQYQIGGLLREFMRLLILTGLALFCFGLIQSFRRK